MTCPYCHGTGRGTSAAVNYYWTACDYCRGSGVLPVPVAASCTGYHPSTPGTVPREPVAEAGPD